MAPPPGVVSSRVSRGASRLIAVAGLIGICAFALAWYWAVVRGYANRYDVWLYDWNVYHAAARDLIDGTLYKAPLVEPGHALPVGEFNYPPIAALWAVPFLPYSRELGGILWLAACGVCVAVGMGFSARAIGLWIAVAGLGGALYTRAPLFLTDVLLGNNNHVMFALLAAFVWAHLNGRQRSAGVLLALAVGTKVWPVALVVLLLRERRWTELRWMCAGLVVIAVATLAWLGLDGITGMVSAVLNGNGMRATLNNAVLWTTAARLIWDWWPSWGGYAVAAVLLALPLTGRLGLGAGILAGLALNANVWHHYLLTVLLAIALMLIALLTAIGRLSWWQRPSVAGEP